MMPKEKSVVVCFVQRTAPVEALKTLYQPSPATPTHGPLLPSMNTVGAPPMRAPLGRFTGPHKVNLPNGARMGDRKSTRLNSSHSQISYAVFCLKKKNRKQNAT